MLTETKHIVMCSECNEEDFGLSAILTVHLIGITIFGIAKFSTKQPRNLLYHILWNNYCIVLSYQILLHVFLHHRNLLLHVHSTNYFTCNCMTSLNILVLTETAVLMTVFYLCNKERIQMKIIETTG